MDFETNETSRLDFVESTANNEPQTPRSKTSLRMHYEAQVQVIRKQIGTLEEARQSLGLSARKICQLLMVDPSAWTRWTREGEDAPPHIWRALQWYMTIQEKIPGLTPHFFVGKDPQTNKEETLLQMNQMLETYQAQAKAMTDKNLQLEKKIQELEGAVRANKVTAMMLGLALIVLALTFFRILYKS